MDAHILSCCIRSACSGVFVEPVPRITAAQSLRRSDCPRWTITPVQVHTRVHQSAQHGAQCEHSICQCSSKCTKLIMCICMCTVCFKVLNLHSSVHQSAHKHIFYISVCTSVHKIQKCHIKYVLIIFCVHNIEHSVHYVH